MSRRKIKKGMHKKRPRGAAARNVEAAKRYQPIRQMKLNAKMRRMKEEEAAAELERVRKMEEAARQAAAAGEILKEMATKILLEAQEVSNEDNA